MMTFLMNLLQKRKIKFDSKERRIRSDNLESPIIYSYYILISCFPHIVNLACKAALSAITNLTYADNTKEGYEDYDPDDVVNRDCIATVRSLVNAVNVFDLLYFIVLTIICRFVTAISRDKESQNMF